MSEPTTYKCLFCRIGSGELRSEVVYESPQVVAFMDIHPIREGHVQIIPRKHYPYYDALPESISTEIFEVGRRLAPALRSLYGVERVAFLFTGGDIAHAHAHVVPMVEPTDITSRQYIVEERVSFKNMPRADDGALMASARRIKEALVGRYASQEDLPTD